MKSLLLTFLSCCSLAGAATVSITVNSNPDEFNNGFVYTDSSGTLLSLGSSVRVGYFDLGNKGTLASSNDYATVK